MEAKAIYTQDGTVDLQGRPVLASSTGKWKACAFLVGMSSNSLISCVHKYINTSLLPSSPLRAFLIDEGKQ